MVCVQYLLVDVKIGSLEVKALPQFLHLKTGLPAWSSRYNQLITVTAGWIPFAAAILLSEPGIDTW